MAKYQAAAYLRLSYTENHEYESDSIANQKKLIEDYLKGHPDIELISEKVDDGYSGILFDRPAFQEMMQDIMEGKVNCVIVKDLSRLGREYIETGRYLRRIFPAYGVRFIAVNDNIDTAHEHAGDDLNISMKNLINDAYCHDISVKTRSALDIKRKKGDYVGACPVYGYRKSAENRNQLVVDEYAARIVRDIFRAKIEGRSAKRIADELNALGVLSPLAYKINRGLSHPKGGFADRSDAKWSATTVIRILQDEVYTGTLVQGRQGTYNHKLKNIIQKPDEEWIRVEKTHAPIIRKADFDLVQHIMELDTRTAPEGETVYLFSGLLVCGCCGARMTRKTNTAGGKKYIYYHCPTGKKHGCTHPVMLREDELTQCVLESVQAHIRNVVSLEKLLDSISEETINRELVAGCKAQIAENRAQLEQIGVFKASLYENFVNGMLDKAEYKALRDSYSRRMEELRSAIDRLRQEIARAVDKTSERQKWIQQFREFSNMTELSRRAVVTLIQSIRIVSKSELKITFRYQLEDDAALQKLAQAQLKQEAV